MKGERHRWSAATTPVAKASAAKKIGSCPPQYSLEAENVGAARMGCAMGAATAALLAEIRVVDTPLAGARSRAAWPVCFRATAIRCWACLEGARLQDAEKSPPKDAALKRRSTKPQSPVDFAARLKPCPCNAAYTSIANRSSARCHYLPWGCLQAVQVLCAESRGPGPHFVLRETEARVRVVLANTVQRRLRFVVGDSQQQWRRRCAAPAGPMQAEVPPASGPGNTRGAHPRA